MPENTNIQSSVELLWLYLLFPLMLKGSVGSKKQKHKYDVNLQHLAIKELSLPSTALCFALLDTPSSDKTCPTKALFKLMASGQHLDSSRANRLSFSLQFRYIIMFEGTGC